MIPGASSKKSNLIGCVLLRIVVDEFSSKSVMEANLSFDFHSKVKRQFEEKCLTATFTLSNKVLSTTVMSISSELVNMTGTKTITS